MRPARPAAEPAPDPRLDRRFFARPARQVARDLIGRRLVRIEPDGLRLAGRIVETEAYCDAETPDLACHGSRNGGRPTARNRVMFGPPGHAYVYFSYGMHWLLNVVTGEPGQPNAVLLRALAPEAGLERMALRRRDRQGRPRPRVDWCSGPARLTQALGIDGGQDGVDLCAADAALYLEAGRPAPELARGPRIGLGRTPEPWRSMPWRYWHPSDPNVSHRGRLEAAPSRTEND